MSLSLKSRLLSPAIVLSAPVLLGLAVTGMPAATSPDTAIVLASGESAPLPTDESAATLPVLPSLDFAVVAPETMDSSALTRAVNEYTPAPEDEVETEASIAPADAEEAGTEPASAEPTASEASAEPAAAAAPVVAPAPAAPAYTVEAASGTYYASTALNVRSGPGTGYGVVGSLGHGEQVSVTGTANGWFELGEGRFASGSYLSTSAPAPAAPAAPASSGSSAPAAAAAPSSGLDTVRAYLSAAGCPSTSVVWGGGERYMQADWYNNTVIVGQGMSTSRYQWAATHECMHMKQAIEYGSPDNVIASLGWDGLECDADQRAARHLGWSAGAYC